MIFGRENGEEWRRCKVERSSSHMGSRRLLWFACGSSSSRDSRSSSSDDGGDGPAADEAKVGFSRVTPWQDVVMEKFREGKRELGLCSSSALRYSWRSSH